MPEVDNPILLDTDIVSLLMKGYLDPTVSGLREHGWCVSHITVGELAKGAAKARWNLRRWTELSEWLGHVVVLPIDMPVSYAWGQLAGAAELRGRPRPVNDMWIAAVSVANHMPLATRNVKDYLDFAEYHGLDLRPT